MSATIPESMRLDDLLKATGYDCPAELQGKTFDQATEGGSAELEDNKTVSITENGVVEITPSEGKDGMKKVTATVNVSGGGADLEDNKTVSITENGVVEITPSEGKDGMKKVTATVNVSGGGASFFEEISLSTDNPTYNKTLTKGASIYLNKYVNMLVGRGDVTETVTSIGKVFATVTYVDSTQVLTVALNTSHPEASDGVSFKVWGE